MRTRGANAWSEADKAKVAREFPHRYASDIGAEIGRSASAVRVQAWLMGVKPVSPRNKSVTGIVPWNKGKRYKIVNTENMGMPQNLRPADSLPVGTEKVQRGNYISVKFTDDPAIPHKKRWKLKHYLIWEAANGPVPDSKKLTFADGNNRNFALENIVLTDSAAVAKRVATQHHANTPPELHGLMAMVGKFKKRIQQKEKINER